MKQKLNKNKDFECDYLKVTSYKMERTSPLTSSESKRKSSKKENQNHIDIFSNSGILVEKTRRKLKRKFNTESQDEKKKKDDISEIEVIKKDKIEKETISNSRNSSTCKLEINDPEEKEVESPFQNEIQVKIEVDDNSENNESVELEDKHHRSKRISTPMSSNDEQYQIRDEDNSDETSDNQDNDVKETSADPSKKKARSQVIYKCSYEGCDKEFAHNYIRRKHIRMIHLNIRNYHCEFCGHRFKTSSAIKSHIAALHTKDVDKTQYVCDVCKKIFYRKIGLELHQTMHTNIKSFVCSFEGCGKAFRLNTNLTKHKKIHSGEKPHHCHICNEGFSRKTYLDTHMYKHTGLKNYRCEICEKTFSQKGNLAVHKLLHSQDRPVYKCPQCPRTFTFKSNMKKHLQKHEIKEKCEERSRSENFGENITDEDCNSQEELSSQSGESDCGS